MHGLHGVNVPVQGDFFTIRAVKIFITNEHFALSFFHENDAKAISEMSNVMALSLEETYC